MSSQKIFFFLVSFTSSCDVRCTLVEREGRGSIKKIPQPIRISITTVIDFLFVIFILWTQNLWGSAHFVFFILCALSIAYLRKNENHTMKKCFVSLHRQWLICNACCFYLCTLYFIMIWREHVIKKYLLFIYFNCENKVKREHKNKRKRIW